MGEGENKTDTPKNGAAAEEIRENPFISLAFNVVVPSVILTQLSKEGRLGPTLALLIAIAFPIVYGIWDAKRRRKINFFSVVGFVSILLTGGLGLLPTRPLWFALKEAAIPATFAAAVLGSHLTKKPLIRLFLWNPEMLDTAKVERKLEAHGKTPTFQRLLFHCSLLLAGALLASAIGNFVISMRLLEGTVGGTAEYMTAVGKQTTLTWLVIGLPMMAIMMFALWYLFRGIRNLTGLSMEDLLHGEAKSVKVSPSSADDQ